MSYNRQLSAKLIRLSGMFFSRNPATCKRHWIPGQARKDRIKVKYQNYIGQLRCDVVLWLKVDGDQK